jgi:ATP-dependent helicase HepA
MSPRQIKSGSLVRVTGTLSRLGPGKVVSRDLGNTTVEFFSSIARRRQETISDAQVQPIERVASQTRCYVLEEDGRWRMGRVGRKDGDDYEVLFRQGEARYLPENRIFVRCLTPIEDPTDTLVFKGHETPYFHDRRFSLVRSLVRQRALGRGMSGLLSSRIDLLPHQVEVVRRVLEDPVQRYLLADEVGLGKTVEAGVVLRQYLLDNRSGTAVVVVPPLLIDQWSEELEDKFQVSRFGPGRISVVSHNEVNAGGAEDGAGLVIIDEAHHIAALAASDSAEDKRRFSAFERLCTMAGSVLLLSATPVLSNERDFLAMLHLLDPNVYPLDDVEGFRARVRNRQEVGQLLLSLQEGSPSFAVKSAIRRLRDYFPADAPLACLCDDLQQAVDL